MNSKPQSRRNLLKLLGSAGIATVTPHHANALVNEQRELAIEEYPYTVAETPWLAILGNHRVKLHVSQASEAVFAYIPWRRVDANPEQKAILVYTADGEEVANCRVATITQEAGEIVFQAKQAGTYFVYYLPHAAVRSSNSPLGPKGRYKDPQPAENGWFHQYGAKRDKDLKQLPSAQVISFDARTPIDSFYPMLVAATAGEIEALYRKYPEPVLIFPESREFPIRMDDMLPLRWIRRGPRQRFSDTAMLGELYVLQLGVHHSLRSAQQDFKISLRYTDLTGPGKTLISHDAWTCLNIDSVDPRGNEEQKEVSVARGKTKALWCAVQIPLTAKPGKYIGSITITVGHNTTTVGIEFDVQKIFIRDGGSDQPWRLARTGWLNSRVGSEETVTSPYKPLHRDGSTVHCLSHSVRFGETGLPISIVANNREILAAPVQISLGGRSLVARKSDIEVENAARITSATLCEAASFTATIKTTVEFDGGMGFDIRIASQISQTLANLTLEIAYPKDSVPYAAGMSLKGGLRPRRWSWKWSDQKDDWRQQGSNLDYFLWLGSVEAGLYCRLQSPHESWSNNDSGSVALTEDGDKVVFRVSTGSRRIRAGEAAEYRFRLLPTPVKPIDPHHWHYRYAHAYEPVPELNKLGATVNNLHQGTLPNMYINYPFLNLDLLRPYIGEAHSLGMKVKLYYTMRELSTRLPELWTFRSLGNEIYKTSGVQGQGRPQLDFWMQEHLRHDYTPGWITETPTGDIDTSLRVYSDSRLANFYLEGLRWLLQAVEIDGLYLDEIGYPRDTMQRVRRVLEKRDGAMIDMHANHDWWSCNCPIGYYMEHLPYIDRLWLGEGFDPDSSPEFWLIEISGIAFGLSSDMLEKPNPWRGMLFGMTCRALYSGPLPTSIWKLWDDFGIEEATMIGWWNKDVPVKTGRPDILATVYAKKGRALIAVASWSSQPVNVRLQIDWKALELSEAKAHLAIPAMEHFQSAQTLQSGQSISVPPAKGYLILVEEKD